MKKEQTIQSLDRGLAVLQLLAEQKKMTATAIAGELGIHQSSASRLLASLEKSGFVCKPDFHSFSLDYGTLIFAGKALHCFPAIEGCAEICNRISKENNLNASVAILRDENLLYLTRVNSDSSLILIDNSDFPIHQSSLGMAIISEFPEKDALTILNNSLDQRRKMSNSETKAERVNEAAVLLKMIQTNINQNGFLFLTDKKPNLFNAAMTFTLGSEKASLAVFSESKRIGISSAEIILRQGIKAINQF